MDKSKHIILTFGLWNYFCAFILRLKSKGCNCPCIIALLYYKKTEIKLLITPTVQPFIWFCEQLQTSSLLLVWRGDDGIHSCLNSCCSSDACWRKRRQHTSNVTGVKGFNLSLGGGAFRLTCWLCVSVWEDTLCVCVPGCHSWSSLSLLQPGHTGGPAGHSGHKTGSVSKLRCKQW